MISYEEVRSLIACTTTGKAFHAIRNGEGWVVDRFNKQYAGHEIGTMHHTGYLVHTIKGKQYGLHRLIFMYHHGFMPEMVDHYDQNKLNNAISNLVPSDVVHNGMNRKINKNNTSGCVGVVWQKSRNKWRAQIKVIGKQITIGEFTDKQDAINARLKKEKEIGFCSNHGSK